MVKSKFIKIILGGSALVMVAACGGPSQEKQFIEGCNTVFADDFKTDAPKIEDAAEITNKFCTCLHREFSEGLSKDDMKKLTTVFTETKTERDFMKAGREAFGEDGFDDLGDIANICEREIDL